MDAPKYEKGKYVDYRTLSDADFVRNLGLINETGEVNLDCVEHALLNGLSWPMKVGPFTFSVDDVKSIVKAIQGRDPHYKSSSKMGR